MSPSLDMIKKIHKFSNRIQSILIENLNTDDDNLKSFVYRYVLIIDIKLLSDDRKV